MRCYLADLISNNTADITACATDPRKPYNPVGSCNKPIGIGGFISNSEVCTARPAVWLPFRLLKGVNLCNR